MSFPGPRSTNITLPLFINTWKGEQTFQTRELHKEYGSVVRIGPTTLSFTSAQAWKDIYGHGTHKPLPKDPLFYEPPVNGVNGVIFVDDAEHTRMRRILSHAFSDKALKEQEGLLKGWSAKMVRKMYEAASKSETGTVDLLKFLNCTTFDMYIAQLLRGGKPRA